MQSGILEALFGLQVGFRIRSGQVEPLGRENRRFAQDGRPPSSAPDFAGLAEEADGGVSARISQEARLRTTAVLPAPREPAQAPSAQPLAQSGVVSYAQTVRAYAGGTEPLVYRTDAKLSSIRPDRLGGNVDTYA